MPPKRHGQRRTITYNFNDIQAAYDEELEDFSEDEALVTTRRGPQQGQKRLSARNERAAQNAWILDGQRAGIGAGGGAEGDGNDLHEAAYEDPAVASGLFSLYELFTPRLERDVIEDVYSSCNRSFEASLQVLMDMVAAAEAQAASGSNAAGGSRDPQGPAGGVNDSSQAHSSEAGDQKENLWDSLHESVKEQVLSHLSARDLAVAARTCRDFAGRVRAVRLSAKTLVIPAGISLSGVVSMVAGHPNARAVSLVRWGASNLKDAAFAALMTAISHGSHSSRRHVRVEALSLRGWTSGSNGNVLTLLETLQHLRELDLSDMHSITDAALGPLSRYTRSDTGLPSSGPLTSVPSSIAAGGSLPGTPSSAGAGGDLAGGMAQLRLSGPQHSHDHKGDEEEGEEVQRAIAASLAEAAAAADAGAVALSEIGHTTGGSVAGISAMRPHAGDGGHAFSGEDEMSDDESEKSEGEGGEFQMDEELEAREAARAARTPQSASRRASKEARSRSRSGAESGRAGLSTSAHADGAAMSTTPQARLPPRSHGSGTEAGMPPLARSGGSGTGGAWGGAGTRRDTGGSPSPSPYGTSPAGGPSSYGQYMGQYMGSSPVYRGPSALYGSSPKFGQTLLGTSPSGLTRPAFGTFGKGSSPVFGMSPWGGSGPARRVSGTGGGGGGGSTTEGPSTPGPSGTTQAVPPGVKDSDTTTPSASTRGAFSTTPGGSNTNESSNNDTAAAVGTPSSGGFLGAGIASANAAAIGTPTAATPSAGGSSGGGGLEVLSLAGCSNLSSDGLRAFLAAPLVKRSLLALDVSRCIRVTRVALALPPTTSLRVLKAAGCNNLHEVVMQLPLSCPLTELWLNNCKALTKLHLVAPNLTLLHVGGCKVLRGLQLRCPRLTQLLANLCFSLSDLDPEEVMAPRLESLNLFGARHITSADLQALAGPASGLRTLNLNGCNAIRAVDLADHLDLKAIDVSGCKSLTTLSCASPSLEEVGARACRQLMGISLPSSRLLRRLDIGFCSSLRSVEIPALPTAAAALQSQLTLGAPSTASAPYLPQSQRQELVASAARTAAQTLKLQGTSAPHIAGLGEGCDALGWDQALQLKVVRAAAALTAPSTAGRKAAAAPTAS